MKNYNKDALRGGSTTDKQFQSQMAEVGIEIPEELLNSSTGMHYAMNEIRKKNIEDLTESLGSPELAKSEAEIMYRTASKEYDKLLKESMSK